MSLVSVKMKSTLPVIILFFFSQIFGQSNKSTVYKNLKTKKVYSVSLSTFISDEKVIYEVNDQAVSKSVYNKYKSKWKNFKSCCPCILKSYDVNDILLSKTVSCTDCGVGWFETYYPNGNIELKGSYKENPTGNWEDIWNRGYCHVPNGQWIYFNEVGDTLYSEFWDNGTFIKQEPEQLEVEIWDVEIKLFNQDANTLTIPVDKVGDLSIEPQYKNSNRSNKLSLSFKVTALGHKVNERKFTLDSFKDIDVDSMLSEVGIPKEKQTSFVLTVYDNDIAIKSFYLKIDK